MKECWSKKARHAFHEQTVWYEANKGHDFVESFSANIATTVKLLATMPSMGVFIKESQGRTYRSFVTHPRCTIYYWYNDKEIHIANLRFSAIRQ